MTHVLLLLSSFNTQYLLLLAGNRSSCYISISGTGRSFCEGGRRLEAQSLPERSGTYQGESCLVTKVSERCISFGIWYTYYHFSFILLRFGKVAPAATLTTQYLYCLFITFAGNWGCYYASINRAVPSLHEEDSTWTTEWNGECKFALQGLKCLVLLLSSIN